MIIKNIYIYTIYICILKIIIYMFFIYFLNRYFCQSKNNCENYELDLTDKDVNEYFYNLYNR